MSIEASAANPRTVTFSRFSQLSLIAIEEGLISNWYSADEQRNFRKELIKDVQRVSMLVNMSTTHSGVVTRELLHECIGVEDFVVPNQAQRVAERRRAHIATVLAEQANGGDIERLSQVSETSSKWAQDKAQKLALTYHVLLNE